MEAGWVVAMSVCGEERCEEKQMTRQMETLPSDLTEESTETMMDLKRNKI